MAQLGKRAREGTRQAAGRFVLGSVGFGLGPDLTKRRTMDRWVGGRAIAGPSLANVWLLTSKLMWETERCRSMAGFAFHSKKGKDIEVPVPLVPLADTHGHLTCFRTLDVSDVLVHASLAGLRLLVVPIDIVDDFGGRWGTAGELLSWLDMQVEHARKPLEGTVGECLEPPAFVGWEVPDLLDNVHIVAGAHPYGADCLDEAALDRLDDLLASPRCVGVGEIGLDFGPHNELGADVQERAFRRQLRLAHERQLPVELHLRDGEDDTAAHDLAIRVLDEEGVPERGCDLHCFTQSPEVMAPFVELGCHIAFGGAVSFRRSDDIRSAACACPRDLLLSETDSPYMAPVPLRGWECEPAMVAFSAALLANVRKAALDIPREETYRALWENACTLFGLRAAG